MPNNALRTYKCELKRKPYPFPCPHCQLTVLPENFERHCLEFHDLNALFCCVWCLGREEWEKGQKTLNARHMLSCFRKFLLLRVFKIKSKPFNDQKNLFPLKNVQNPTPENVQNPTLLDMTPMCDPESFFEHEDFRHLLPSRAFQQFNLLDDESLVTYFRDPNLNSAASYVKKYIRERDQTDWYHVMIKAVSFESFLKAIDDNQGKVFLLPFSCWCDGGVHKEAWYRQHRHMIIISDKDHFLKNIWPKIKAKQPFPRNFACKRMKKIESPMHLVNTMGYLCKRESRCEFSFLVKNGRPLVSKHFYMLKTLLKNYRLPLAGQWDGGLSNLMHLEFFQNVSVFKLVNSPLILEDGKYKQRIKDFYKFQGGLVLPLSKEFITDSTGKETRHVFHLLNGQKLHFEESEENLNLDDETWLRKQVQDGNCFYENVWTEMWVPRPRDQRMLRDMMPIVEENWKLQSTVENLNEKLDSLEIQYEKEIVQYEKEIVCLKRKHEKEIENLNTKYEMLWEKHQKLIDAAAAAAREKDEKI